MEKNQSWQKILKKLLFPPVVIIVFLCLITAVGMIYIFSNHYENTKEAILFYGIASYSLVILCIRIPQIVRYCRKKIENSSSAQKLIGTKEERMRRSMYQGLYINIGFAAVKIVMGFIYNSKWLYAMAGYNIILSLMRLVVVLHSQKKGISEWEQRKRGLKSYQVCGWMMLALNIAVSVIMMMVIVDKQTISYHPIVTIELTTYTFYAFTVAVVNMVKYKERKNPVYTTLKCIQMAKAIVSVFTTQVALITVFSTKEDNFNGGLMNTLTGIGVTIAIHCIAASMLIGAKQDLKEMGVNGKQ